MILDDTSLRLEPVGRLRRIASSDINASGISVGMECLDREMFDFDRCYDKLGAIGVKWARCQTGWSRCETEKGVYDFTWLDHIVDSLLGVGVQPWFNVSYGNKLYMPDAYGETAVGFVPLYYGEGVVEAWKAYVAALAVHFAGRVTRWEIWNEPDIPNFWQPHSSDPVDYARLIRITAAEIRKAVPDAEIGACSATKFNDAFHPQFIATGIGSELQFFCIHDYAIQPEKDYENITGTLRRLFAAHGGGHVRIAVGETGYASHFPEGHWMGTYVMDSEENQAKWLLRRYVLDRSRDLSFTSFFQMADMVKNYEMGNLTRTDVARHGLLDGETYEPKASYAALAHVAAVFDGDTRSTPLYGSVDTYAAVPRGTPVSRLLDVATRFFTFTRKGYPLYVYYLPEDVQHGFEGLKNVRLWLLPGETGKTIREPVLVDMLSGVVYGPRHVASNADGINRIEDLPLTDYPLLLTDRAALAGRIRTL